MQETTADNKSILEALLFVSPEPLTVKQIMSVLDGVTDLDVAALIDELAQEYESRGGGLQIVKVAEGYQMLTRLECSPWLRKLEIVKVSNKLTQPALETLAIVAYKQPVIKAELDAIRGVSSDGVLKTLLDRNLVKILGRKEMPGRPLLYGTTPEFLRYFGLQSISELPTLRDIEEIDGTEPLPHPSLEDIRELATAVPENHPESQTENPIVPASEPESALESMSDGEPGSEPDSGIVPENSIVSGNETEEEMYDSDSTRTLTGEAPSPSESGPHESPTLIESVSTSPEQDLTPDSSPLELSSSEVQDRPSSP